MNNQRKTLIFIVLLLFKVLIVNAEEESSRGSASDLLALKKIKLIQKAADNKITTEELRQLRTAVQNSLIKCTNAVDYTMSNCLEDMHFFFFDHVNIEKLRSKCLKHVAKSHNLCAKEYAEYKALLTLEPFEAMVFEMQNFLHRLEQAQRHIADFLAELFILEFDSPPMILAAKKRFLRAVKAQRQDLELWGASCHLLAFQQPGRFFGYPAEKLAHKIAASQGKLCDFACNP